MERYSPNYTHFPDTRASSDQSCKDLRSIKLYRKPLKIQSSTENCEIQIDLSFITVLDTPKGPRNPITTTPSTVPKLACQS